MLRLDRKLIHFVLRKSFGEFLDISQENIDVQLTQGHVVVRDCKLNAEVCNSKSVSNKLTPPQSINKRLEVLKLVDGSIQELHLDLAFTNPISSSTRLCAKGITLRLELNEKISLDTSMSMQESVYYMASEFLSQSLANDPDLQKEVEKNPFADELQLLMDHLTEFVKLVSFQLSQVRIELVFDRGDSFELQIDDICRLPQERFFYKRSDDEALDYYILDKVGVSNIHFVRSTGTIKSLMCKDTSLRLELAYREKREETESALQESTNLLPPSSPFRALLSSSTRPGYCLHIIVLDALKIAASQDDVIVLTSFAKSLRKHSLQRARSEKTRVPWFITIPSAKVSLRLSETFTICCKVQDLKLFESSANMVIEFQEFDGHLLESGGLYTSFNYQLLIICRPI